MTTQTSRILGRIIDLRKLEPTPKNYTRLLDALEEAITALDDQTEQYPSTDPHDSLINIERTIP